MSAPGTLTVAEELERGNADLAGDWLVVCAWCKREMRGNPQATKVSHGMCGECAETWLRPAAGLEAGQ